MAFAILLLLEETIDFDEGILFENPFFTFCAMIFQYIYGIDAINGTGVKTGKSRFEFRVAVDRGGVID